MTSGVFHSLSIDSIHVDREARQRRELEKIDELAASIALRGLINPVLVQRETLELIAGERRLAACKRLGWSHISAQYEDEADQSALRALELEENVRRVDLPWQDHCLAILDFHRIQKALDSDWSQSKTAVALNMSEQDLSKKIGVAEEIIGGNTMVIEAPKLTTAVGITERAKSRARDSAADLTGAMLKAPAQVKAAPIESILNADFNEWALTYDGPRFNFVHCDFPYGIGASNFNQGSASLHGGYSDSKDDYWRLCTTLRDNFNRLCSDSCHLIFWFSMRAKDGTNFYNQTLEFFATTPFVINPLPLVWIKSDNSGILPDPERGPRHIYETAFFGAADDRKIVRAKSDAISLPSEKDIHMSIKPQGMLEYFFAMFVDGNTRMLDPTCGSGSSLRAAERLGASSVLGLERDPLFAADANRKLEAQRRKVAA